MPGTRIAYSLRLPATGEGRLTERAELREAPDVRLRMGVESWYAFSFLLPADFPIVETRLVIARWKQSFNEPSKDRSPMVSLRYIEGNLKIYVERDRGQRELYIEKIDLRNKWVDMVFHIIPKAFKGGLLQVWKNGKQIVDYKGELGFKDDTDEIYFKLGLYRDQMQVPKGARENIFTMYFRSNIQDVIPGFFSCKKT